MAVEIVRLSQALGGEVRGVDPGRPLELLRTIHSFDPCIACAVHLYDEKGDYRHQLDTF